MRVQYFECKIRQDEYSQYSRKSLFLLEGTYATVSQSCHSNVEIKFKDKKLNIKDIIWKYFPVI